MNCPYCGKEVTATDGFCEHCDAYLGKKSGTAKAKAGTKVVVKAGESTIACKNCGKIVPENSFYCPYCHKIAKSSDYNAGTASAGGVSVLGIAAFILAFVQPLIGLLLAILSIVAGKNTAKEGQEFGMLGLIISIVLIILNAILFKSFGIGLVSGIGDTLEWLFLKLKLIDMDVYM